MPNQSRAPNNDDGSGIEDREKRRRADLWEQTTNKARKVFHIKHSKRSFGISLSAAVPRSCPGQGRNIFSCLVPMFRWTSQLISSSSVGVGRPRKGDFRGYLYPTRVGGGGLTHLPFLPFPSGRPPPPGCLLRLEEERGIGLQHCAPRKGRKVTE